MVPLYCGGSSLSVGLDEWLVKVSWLGWLALVFWWVELDFFSLDAMKCPVVSFEMSYGFGVTSGSLCITAQSYIPGVAGEFAWYVLLWSLSALGWSLVSV